ncbi:MAG: hypothetical protein QM749_18775 [Aquabacterium sp.]
MNFQEFQTWRQTCLQQQPGLLDCGETNLYRALGPWQLQAKENSENTAIYRCDLARAWLSHYGWPEARSRQALVCRGVRHALHLIFQQLASNEATLWLPGDVYPVYASIASAYGLRPDRYATLPIPALPALTSADLGHAEFLLLCNPWKPLGRYLTRSECSHLKQWLQQSSRRFLVLDCVYDLGAPLHETTRELEATGKAIVLHSLTKAWLWPETFGVALVPDQLQSKFEKAFRDDAPSLSQLNMGHTCLLKASDRPREIANVLEKRSTNLKERLPASVLNARITPDADLAHGTYMLAVDIDAQTLLARYGILALPASVYGATDWNGSILTSLSSEFSCQQPRYTDAA